MDIQYIKKKGFCFMSQILNKLNFSNSTSKINIEGVNTTPIIMYDYLYF